jgi:ArsR family transcriptional regulator, arsenate/arsenite/antimonite-responsive transcriptional repressor
VSVSQLPVRQRGVPCCERLVQANPAWAQETAEVLKALAEPTRLSMIAALWAADAAVCICDFTATFDLSQPTISHHMGKLKAAGLVEATKQGIWVYYSLREDLPPSVVDLLRALVEPLDKTTRIAAAATH